MGGELRKTEIWKGQGDKAGIGHQKDEEVKWKLTDMFNQHSNWTCVCMCSYACVRPCVAQCIYTLLAPGELISP